MAKLEPFYGDNADQVMGYIFHCPGCKLRHTVHVRPCDPNGVRWDFDGDMERPTFSPSIVTRYTFTDGRADRVCHPFVTDGQIRFLSDCTHDLAGQTSPIPDLEEHGLY